MSQRLRFGIFLAPFHKPGINATLALQSDLDLIQWLDRCGYDEAWLGEHHSAGTELSASPEIMIATAAERTRHIKLGTGVISVSYHNPLWVAERIVLLDHLTRGRAMLGLGPGSLPTDGVMIGLQQSQTRGLLAVRNPGTIIAAISADSAWGSTSSTNLDTSFSKGHSPELLGCAAYISYERLKFKRKFETLNHKRETQRCKDRGWTGTRPATETAKLLSQRRGNTPLASPDVRKTTPATESLLRLWIR